MPDYFYCQRTERRDIENKRNLKNTTLKNLKEEIKKTEHRIEVEEHRKNLTMQKMKQAKRKARNHRLIVTRVELEKVLPESKALKRCCSPLQTLKKSRIWWHGRFGILQAAGREQKGSVLDKLNHNKEKLREQEERKTAGTKAKK